MKKNTTFVRKLAKITEDQRDKLIAELSTLNTSKFILEAINSIAQELTVSLKPTDIAASVQVKRYHCVLNPELSTNEDVPSGRFVR